MDNIINSRICLNCKGCCYFENKKDAKLAPLFSEKEIEKIGENKKYLEENKKGFLQAKVVKAKNKKGYFCVFLNQKDYKCKIYKNLPLDCKTWPFVVGYDKEKKGIFLWVVNKNYCPHVNVKKISKNKINEITNFLNEKGFIDEINNKKRFIWPYEKYQIRLKKIKI